MFAFILVYNIIVSIWIYTDAQQHGRNKWGWALGTLVFPYSEWEFIPHESMWERLYEIVCK